MNKYLKGTRQEFEAWIKDTIGSDFRWLIRPMATPTNREMVDSLILKDLEPCNGVFPEKKAFIEETKNQDE